MENNQDKGFTLVELLIVIVILGILATVTVFAVRGITDKGQENACAVEARTLDTAIEAFYAQNQADPTVVTTAGAVLGLVPDYLKDAPDTSKFAFYAIGATVPATTATTTTAAVAAYTAVSAEFVAIGPCA
jgi:prepilin-type N-terminal cleavage/methylation domain-containing protein